jgi:hypothetical protein
MAISPGEGRETFSSTQEIEEALRAISPLKRLPRPPGGVNCVFSEYLRSCAVQQERHNLGDDFAEIWRSAQRRRSDDVYFWFTNIFEKRWQFKSPSRYVGLLFRSFTRSPFLLPETEQVAREAVKPKGGRSGQ